MLLLTVTGCEGVPGVSGSARDVVDAGVFRDLGDGTIPPASADDAAIERALGIVLLDADWGPHFVNFEHADFDLWATPRLDKDCRMTAVALPEGTPATATIWSLLPRLEHRWNWRANEDEIWATYEFAASSTATVHTGPLTAAAEVGIARDAIERCSSLFAGEATYEGSASVELDGAAGYDEAAIDHGALVTRTDGEVTYERYANAVARKGDVVVTAFVLARTDAAGAHKVGGPEDLEVRRLTSDALAEMLERIVYRYD